MISQEHETNGYTLRFSKKAKYLQIRLSVRGFEVIIPTIKNFSKKTIDKFIEEKQWWINKHKLCIENSAMQSLQVLPTTIHLNAINVVWNIRYMQTDNKIIRVYTNPNNQITLVGNIDNKYQCIQKLRSWLKELAKDHLYQELLILSNETGLRFKRFTIRNNTTRWGSCSSTGSISLCCKLLFLARHHMRHIILHELCHTKVMTHGVKFWRLLSMFDPKARQHAKEIRAKELQIPSWVSRNI